MGSTPGGGRRISQPTLKVASCMTAKSQTNSKWYSLSYLGVVKTPPS